MHAMRQPSVFVVVGWTCGTLARLLRCRDNVRRGARCGLAQYLRRGIITVCHNRHRQDLLKWWPPGNGRRRTRRPLAVTDARGARLRLCRGERRQLNVGSAWRSLLAEEAWLWPPTASSSACHHRQRWRGRPRARAANVACQTVASKEPQRHKGPFARDPNNGDLYRALDAVVGVRHGQGDRRARAIARPSGCCFRRYSRTAACRSQANIGLAGGVKPSAPALRITTLVAILRGLRRVLPRVIPYFSRAT